MDNITRLIKSFPFFAGEQLKIKPKVGRNIPFKLNKAQKYIHKRAYGQKQRTGRVRLIVLKGRQQGASTYICARGFHKVSTQRSVSAFIFAHDSSGSKSLYEMVQRYYNEATDPSLLPERTASNAKEIKFNAIDSGYLVGTAGTTGLGRSKTNQFVHWSEVAYSPNASDHARGLLQTVPDENDTEVWLESTANGMGDYFHTACMRALRGEGEFELVFVPWFWQDEYTRDGDIELSHERGEGLSEAEYYEKFKDQGLTKEHLAWRRNKIATDFHGDEIAFMREYPFTVEEAFQASADRALIAPTVAARAAMVKTSLRERSHVVIGCDPAWAENDKADYTALVARQGRIVLHAERFRKDTAMTAFEVMKLFNRYNAYKICLDIVGVGVGVYDQLKLNGFANHTLQVWSGKPARDSDRFSNIRSELWHGLKEWIEDEPVQIPNDPVLISEISSVEVTRDTRNRLALVSKEQMRKDGKKSPDLADALAFTFACPVPLHNPERRGIMIPQQPSNLIKGIYDEL